MGRPVKTGSYGRGRGRGYSWLEAKEASNRDRSTGNERRGKLVQIFKLQAAGVLVPL